jgi:tungstate transport system substrate-binding protein
MMGGCAALLVVAAIGCKANPEVLRLATTTSVESSGLLAEVLPAFERQSHIKVDVLAVGSGRALNLLRRGEVAVGLTHDPRAEAQALASGIITDYRKIMFNDFIIVGPSEDSAGVAAASGVADAFARIAAAGALFVSRGDASGTYSREQELWALVERRPSGDRLLETGQGMGGTLRVANEMNAYTLTDRATFEQFRSGLRLVPLHEGGPELLNTYAVFLRAGLAGRERAAATDLATWLSDGYGRRLVAGFMVHGRTVFNVWPRGTSRTRPADLPPRELADAR